MMMLFSKLGHCKWKKLPCSYFWYVQKGNFETLFGANTFQGRMAAETAHFCGIFDGTNTMFPDVFSKSVVWWHSTTGPLKIWMGRFTQFYVLKLQLRASFMIWKCSGLFLSPLEHGHWYALRWLFLTNYRFWPLKDHP